MFGSSRYLAVLLITAVLAIPAAKAQGKSALTESGGGSGAAIVQRIAQANPPDYKVGPGDVLGVEVWNEPDASSQAAPVRLDGKMLLPIVGEVEVAGLTPAELQDLLTARYREYVRDARVTIVVKEINSKKIYLVGEVKREGSVRLQAPLTVLQALAEGGGVTDYAKRHKIYVLRTVGDRQVRLPFDLDAVVRGEKPEQNVMLVPGDTIVVPR